MGIRLVTAPSEEPVTLAEAKSHLRVDITDDDALIGALITAAREQVEAITRRALTTQTWDVFLDAFPASDTLELGQPPLQSVTWIKHTDIDNVVTTWAASNYVVDTSSEPGRVRLASGASWPSVSLQVVNAVNVRFVAGYGGAENVPRSIRQAVLLLVAHWYENREPVMTSGGVPKEIPATVQALLWPHRVLTF